MRDNGVYFDSILHVSESKNQIVYFCSYMQSQVAFVYLCKCSYIWNNWNEKYVVDIDRNECLHPDHEMHLSHQMYQYILGVNSTIRP